MTAVRNALLVAHTLAIVVRDLATGRIYITPHLCERCERVHHHIRGWQRDRHIETGVMPCRCGGALQRIGGGL